MLIEKVLFVGRALPLGLPRSPASHTMDPFLEAHPDVTSAVAFALKEVADARPQDPVSFVAQKLREFSTRGSDSDESKSDGKDDEEVFVPRRRGRRDNVFAEPVKLDESWTPTVIAKTDEQKAEIREVILKNILFASLDEDQRGVIIDIMAEKSFEKGDVLIKQGDMGDFYYILSDGTCDIFKDGALVLQCSKGMGFGELALMYDAPRAATVSATSHVKAWAIDRISFKQVMVGTTTKKRKTYEGFLENVPILATLSTEERLTVADALQTVTFAEGQVVVEEGSTDADRFYIVEEGELMGTKAGIEGEVCPRITRGSYFGELALILDQPRAATIKAVTKTTCAAMDRAAFLRLLGPMKDILQRNMELYSKYETELSKAPPPPTGLFSDDEDDR